MISTESHLAQQWTALYMLEYTFITWVKLIDDLYRVTSDSAMNNIIYEEIYIQYMGKID